LDTQPTITVYEYKCQPGTDTGCQYALSGNSGLYNAVKSTFHWICTNRVEKIGCGGGGIRPTT
jgi:hypothetical protein